MSTTIFVYYKVARADFHDAQVAATALIEAVARSTGTRGRLMQRADDEQTWMEVYGPLAEHAQLLAVIEQELPNSGLLPYLLGPRHTEVFTEKAAPQCA